MDTMDNPMAQSEPVEQRFAPVAEPVREGNATTI